MNTFSAGMVSDETSERVGTRGPFETPADFIIERTTPPAEPKPAKPAPRQPIAPAPAIENPAVALFPERPRFQSSDAALERANTRLPIVRAFDALLQEGHSHASARAALKRRGIRESESTLRNWWRAYQAQGFPGLLGQAHRSGRPSAVKRMAAEIGEAQTAEILAAIRATAYDTNSAVLAARFVGRSDSAPAAFAEMIDYREDGRPRRSKRNLPKSFRDQIRINPAIALKHQGNRASDLRGLSTPRRVDVFPGDIFTSDDTTPIWGWWTPWEHALGNPHYEKASCEYRFGVKLMQGQLLPVMDFASNCILMVALIARETASYRAEDIAALYGRVFGGIGLPRIGFQFERGTWESNVLMGVKVDVTEGDLTLSHRVGGLQMLPTHITAAHREMHGADFPFPRNLQIFQSFLPKTKPVEAAFNRLQAVEGMLYGNLGRDQMRRPNERSKKQFEACKRGSADPRLHFLSATELLARLTPLYHFINTESMEGQVFRGVPQMLWDRSIADHPLYRLPEESQYLFRRNWQVARVSRGMIALKRKDAYDNTSTEYYTHPETFLRLEGRQVLSYWDHEDVESPAQIHDIESRKFLCLADHQVRVGTFFDISTGGHETRKRYKNAVNTFYADIVARAPSRQLPAEIAERRAAAASPVPSTGRAAAASAPAAPGEPTTRTNLDAYRADGAAGAAPIAPALTRAGQPISDPRNQAVNDPRLAELIGEDND
jgi:hypothetical protein